MQTHTPLEESNTTSPRSATPPPINITLQNINGNDSTLLSAKTRESLLTPSFFGDLTDNAPKSTVKTPGTGDASPLPPLFKMEQPSPISIEFSAPSIPTGTPVANLENCELAEWYFGQ